MAPRVFVIIPAYNEADAIADILEELASLPYQVVVVDDGSSDNTVQQALRYPVTVLHHMINLGQGAALQTGILYAQRAGAEIIVTFDADGQHSVADIPCLIKTIHQGYDFVLGSRFLQSEKTAGMPASRRFVLKLAILFTRLMTGLRLTDTHNGLRAFTAEAVRGLQISQNRMAHASELLTYIARQRLKYKEVPVTIRYTAYSLRKGQSIWNSLNILLDLLSEKLR